MTLVATYRQHDNLLAMRALQLLPIASILLLNVPLACDPGASTDSASTGGRSGVPTTSTKERSPLWDTPVDPPGTVDMTPPAAGELDVFEQNRALGRGINLGNALDAPREGSWGVTLHQYMFQVIKDAGFDSIRLPVKWSAYADTTAPYTISTKIFDRVDWAIAHALTRGLRIVVDIHHYGNTDEEGMYDQPEKHHDRFLAIWKQIAEHYRNYPKELYFEVLNEPRQKLEPLWNDYMAEAVSVIRESNPGRTLVVGGIWWNKWDALARVVWPDDQNIIATFHYYNPYCFTLQDGQNWEPACVIPGDSKRKPTPGEASWPLIYPNSPAGSDADQRAKLEQDMASAAEWSKSANRPLYMGEFGVAQSADEAARADYTAALAKAASDHGISWAYWEFASSMGIWTAAKMTWEAPMLAALLDNGSSTASGGTGNTATTGTGGTTAASSANGGAAGAVASGGTGGL